MTKLLFHILNLIFVILYIYPGSILGFIMHNDFNKQPQITTDYIVSSNHFYVFTFWSIIGFIGYFKSNKYLITGYFFFISIILELLHLFIPIRAFEYSDLFGNIIGVVFSLIIINLYILWKKNEFI